MEEKTIKRSIRIPKEIDEILKEESRGRGRSVNQVILDSIGKVYGIEVRELKRGRRWR